jgi:hypothetical protein
MKELEYIYVKNVTHKFEDRTTTCNEIKDIIDWGGYYIVILYRSEPITYSKSSLTPCLNYYRCYGNLTPRNPEKDALKQQIEEKEKELKELKDKLNKL